jgi:1-deoxy-D-xylulose-5-phosphate reductoisomerase
VATGGVVSLRPVLAALEAGKVVATANKETLVCGGHLVMPRARARAAEVAASDPASPMASALAWLRPIDSEHSALWQCLVGEDPATVRRLVLTASGGPFRDWPQDRLAHARPEQALTHPTWDMGAKITIDSATLMNKGLEVIEARYLFGLEYSQIHVVIHPEGIVHALAEFRDGTMIAQFAQPDMRLPIQLALGWPERLPSGIAPVPLVDKKLTFEPVDREAFQAVDLAYRVGELGLTFPAVMSAANEVAVMAFLESKIPLTRIVEIVQAVVDEHEAPSSVVSVVNLERADTWARRRAAEIVEER